MLPFLVAGLALGSLYALSGIGLVLLGAAIGSSAKRVTEDLQNVLRVMRKSSAPFLTP